MTIRRIRGVRTQCIGGDPLPQKRAVRLVMRVFGSSVLFVAVLASVVACGSLAVSGGAPAGASPAGITVHCPADNLQTAINAAATGSTLRVDGTCTGNFSIDKDLTLSGPAILDGGGVPTTFGATLNVISGTVEGGRESERGWRRTPPPIRISDMAAGQCLRSPRTGVQALGVAGLTS
jgi:hypothetical protein